VSPTKGNTSRAELIDELLAHKMIGTAPRDEITWLAEHGEVRSYVPGEVVVPKTQLVVEMVIVLSGHVAIYVERGKGRRKVMEWRGGEVTGLLPYSRMTYPPGESVIEEPTRGLVVHRDLFTEMVNTCPTVTGNLVHIMIDRARQFTSTDWQDEKMMSLGRLAAGLAHELNNPASAVARSSKLLAGALVQAEGAAHALGAARISDAERSKIEALRDGSLIPATTGVFSAIERADREDEVTTWLEAHRADVGPAQALSESGVTVDALDELADSLSADTLDLALRSIAAGYSTRSLASDIERAATRIYDLVSAVKRFTFMDRATVAEPSSIAQGVVDTVAVLASKAKAKSVTIRVDVPDTLPRVRAYGGELNQVWANLLENALDAVSPGGEIVVSARRDGERVVVRVVDDGAGIPPDICPRIFDPFFTTKPVGQGTGLGLDISRRIVQRHEGQIEVESRPGRTEFKVTLPVDQVKAS
jgi:signal transduction histidine kinase